jgi:hypothetical protein
MMRLASQAAWVRVLAQVLRGHTVGHQLRAVLEGPLVVLA